MFFNRDKKIGRNLALIAIMLPEQQMKNEATSHRQFSEIEAQRFKFCLSILNLVTLIWWVNFLESNTNRAKKVIDNIVESFMDVFKNKPDRIRIGDFIVYPAEVTLIDMHMGQIGISENTLTNYKTIIPIIYNNRVGQYSNVLNERAQIAFNSEKKQFSLDPVARLFVEHFTGDEWKKQVDLVIELSILLGAFNIALCNTVKEML